MKFFQKFGWGLLYIFLSPILLAILAILAVYGILNFIVQFFIMVVNFFRGKKLFKPFPEDEEAYDRLQKIYEKDLGGSQPAQPAGPSTVYVQQNYYTNPNQVPNNGAPQGMGPAMMPPYNQNPQQMPPYQQQQGQFPPYQQQGQPLPPYQNQQLPPYQQPNQNPMNQIPQNNRGPVIDVSSAPQIPPVSDDNDGGDDHE